MTDLGRAADSGTVAGGLKKGQRETCQGHTVGANGANPSAVGQKPQQNGPTTVRRVRECAVTVSAMTNQFPIRSGRHLYLLQNRVTGNIKIGSSNDVEKRVRGLETGSGMPMELLRVLEDDGRFEEELHMALDEHRVMGEWFRPTPDLLAFARGSEPPESLLMDLYADDNG